MTSLFLAEQECHNRLIPLNYFPDGLLDLPDRCLRIIEEGWDRIATIYPREGQDLGPLTSTFLISMSIPIINLPIERIATLRGRSGPNYADDRHINTGATKALDQIFASALKNGPFFEQDAWHYVFLAGTDYPNIAQGLQQDIAAELGTAQSAADAGNLIVSQWLRILRNALAHGGIAYLDESGYSSWGTPVRMYAFVSQKTKQNERGENVPIGLNFLRVKEENYRSFLRNWVEWLRQSGISELQEAA